MSSLAQIEAFLPVSFTTSGQPTPEQWNCMENDLDNIIKSVSTTF